MAVISSGGTCLIGKSIISPPPRQFVLRCATLTTLECDLARREAGDVSGHGVGCVALLTSGKYKVSGYPEVHVYHGLCFGAFLRRDTQLQCQWGHR